MQSSLIGKVQKAQQYAREPHRIHFESLAVRFAGDNNEHHIRLDNETWHCDCEFFSLWRTCSHTMALEKLLDGMVSAVTVPSDARAAG